MEGFIEKMPLEAQRKYGMEELKRRMWGALGVDNFGRGKMDDTPDGPEADLPVKKTPYLKRIERGMEKELESPPDENRPVNDEKRIHRELYGEKV